MGQRSMSYSNQFVDLGVDQRGQVYTPPEPCMLYGSFTSFPHSNGHTMIPATGSIGNFYVPHLPGHQEGALIYGMLPANGIQQWPHLTNGTAFAPPNYYNPYVTAPSVSTDVPVPVHHGLHDRHPVSGTQGVVGNNADNFGRNDPHIDNASSSFKQKNFGGIHGNLQHHSASAGPSTSAVSVNTSAHESDVSLNDSVSRVHGGNDSASSLGDGVQRSRSSSASSPDTVLQNTNNQLLQGSSYVGQPYQFPGNPWLNQPVSSSGTHTWTWNQAAPLPYLPGGAGGYILDSGNIGMQGYQVTSSNGGLTSFVYPPIYQGPLYPQHLPPNMQFTGGHTLSFSPQMTAASTRHQQTSLSNSANNPLQGVVEGGSGYMGPFVPAGFRMYRPHQREFMLETNTRHHNLPNGVAMLGVPGYRGVGVSIDQHSDMRLDVDHMSYEELLALGERIGNVKTGLSDEAIATNLKTRIFLSTETPCAPESVACPGHKTDFCVICQTDYEAQDKIGILECGHEYHEECVKKWLVLKNTCAICKSAALSREKKDA
ncbi:unnamed protein product [Withania somnifera]